MIWQQKKKHIISLALCFFLPIECIAPHLIGFLGCFFQCSLQIINFRPLSAFWDLIGTSTKIRNLEEGYSEEGECPWNALTSDQLMWWFWFCFYQLRLTSSFLCVVILHALFLIKWWRLAVSNWPQKETSIRKWLIHRASKFHLELFGFIIRFSI